MHRLFLRFPIRVQQTNERRNFRNLSQKKNMSGKKKEIRTRNMMNYIKSIKKLKKITATAHHDFKMKLSYSVRIFVFIFRAEAMVVRVQRSGEAERLTEVDK